MDNTFVKFDSTISLKQYLLKQALDTYEDLFGTEGNSYFFRSGIAIDQFSVANSDLVFAQSSFSETNTQVDGVDEADFIETDGKFIYHVNGQLLTILDARQPENLDIATQVSLGIDDNSSADTSLAIDSFFPVDGWSDIDGMYLQGDRLTVIASGWSRDDNNAASSRFYFSGTEEVQVTVFDVADPKDISVLESTTLEGSLVTSRAIGDEVYVVTSTDFQLPRPLVIKDSVASDNSQALSFRPLSSPGSQGTYETESQYIKRIQDQILDLTLPRVETTDASGKQVASGLLVKPKEVYQPLIDNPLELTTVSTFDVGDKNLGVDAATSIPSDWVGEVFVSKDYMYLLQTNYQGRNTETEILKYDLDSSALVAEGTVPGSIDSQFSVDEHDGFLRISTTQGFGNRATNNVYVLEQQQASLDIVGKVEDLAPGERIFSTRFQGDYGFVVTFRDVDPLFTLDLSNPKDPKVLGELKIPGFSEYLQVIPDGERTLLLGVGQDADPETGRVGSLKVSLFDVTDLENPTEIDNYIFEDDFTSSTALWDHRAITYSSEHQLLAIPTNSYNSTEYRSESTLHVFDVDGTDGLTSLGEVNHDDDWIYRSLYIDDTLFAVSNQEVSAHQIPTLEELDTVSWSGEGQGERILLPVDSAPFSGTAQDEVIRGNVNRDVIRGERGYDKILGQDGNDRILGNRGDDELYGGKDEDFLKGGNGIDKLWGGQGDDSLKGGRGEDELNGGAGQDRLHGGFDADTLTGGGKGDRFIFKKAAHSLLSAYDTILDLDINEDRIKGRYKVAAADVKQLGSVDDLQPKTIQSLLTRSAFVAKGAATFTFGNETFLALNNKTKGFQPQSDAIIKITGYTGNLENLQIF